jgi:hypothetical protein
MLGNHSGLHPRNPGSKLGVVKIYVKSRNLAFILFRLFTFLISFYFWDNDENSSNLPSELTLFLFLLSFSNLCSLRAVLYTIFLL